MKTYKILDVVDGEYIPEDSIILVSKYFFNGDIEKFVKWYNEQYGYKRFEIMEINIKV